MGWFVLEPEVAGGWGERTVADTTTHPPRVSSLHYQMDGWLGDELLESFPCFIVTRRLAGRLRRAGLTGFRLVGAEVTASEQFWELHPGHKLPAFEWLQIDGIAGRDDFGLSPDHRLIVSGRALEALQAGHIDHAQVEPWPPG